MENTIQHQSCSWLFMVRQDGTAFVGYDLTEKDKGLICLLGS